MSKRVPRSTIMYWPLNGYGIIMTDWWEPLVRHGTFGDRCDAIDSAAHGNWPGPPNPTASRYVRSSDGFWSPLNLIGMRDGRLHKPGYRRAGVSPMKDDDNDDDDNLYMVADERKITSATFWPFDRFEHDDDVRADMPNVIDLCLPAPFIRNCKRHEHQFEPSYYYYIIWWLNC